MVRTSGRRAPLAAGLTIAVALVGAIVGLATPSHAATQGPCDIYAAGGTPCVAAHSTVRPRRRPAVRPALLPADGRQPRGPGGAAKPPAPPAVGGAGRAAAPGKPP